MIRGRIALKLSQGEGCFSEIFVAQQILGLVITRTTICQLNPCWNDHFLKM